MIESIQKDTFFWLSLPLVALVLSVPQIRNVLIQTVEIPALASPAQLLQNSTWQATGFLAFLAFLATGGAAALLFVVPPSFLSEAGDGVHPIRLPRPPRRRIVLGGLVFLIALPCFVLLPIPPAVLILLAVVLFFPSVSRFVDKQSGWLVITAEHLTPRGRWITSAVMIGCWLMITYVVGATGQSSRLYPLAGTAFQGFGLIALLTGVWLVCIPKPVVKGVQPLGQVLTAQGRLLGFLIASWIVGELLWLLASIPFTHLVFSYRLYTIWTVVEILVLIVLIASLFDTWQVATDRPVRLAGLGIGLLLILVSRSLDPERLEKPSSEVARIAPGDWPRVLRERVQQIPPGQPVVIVAASGGGSRAAIFTGLVLEGLARERLSHQPDDSWARHIVLISGVSGGSLGSARFVHGLEKGDWAANDRNVRPDLLHSVKADLASRMEHHARILYEHFQKQKPDLEADIRQISDPETRQSREELLKATETAHIKASEFCLEFKADRLEKADPNLRWVVESAVMDDLCTDFMAPVLRGILTPVISRGESLRHFWTKRFGWDGSNDRLGYGSLAVSPTYKWSIHPLVIFNATDVSGGERVAFGFPPLPPGLLRQPLVENPALTALPRHPPLALADIDPTRSLDLAQEVGLSANFPFGFNPILLPRDNPPGVDDNSVKLLDGGIADNTGIDTLFLVLKALSIRAKSGDKDYVELWKELIAHRVILIEIDSGAKPGKPGFMTRNMSLFLDPLAALNNAAFTNAAKDKQHYLDDLRSLFTRSVDLTDLRQRLARAPEGQKREDKSILQELLRTERDGIVRFLRVKFECNHLDDESVLTAWSLGPGDKALLLVRFLIEIQLARAELAQIAALPAQTADDEERVARENAALLVEKRFKVLEAFKEPDTAIPSTRALMQKQFNQRADLNREIFERRRPTSQR